MNTNEFKMRAARANRQEQTEAEAMLWQLLRNRNFENLKFRRQHPLKEYIVDFFCHELQLIIELDGGYHQQTEQKEKDQLRDLHLKALGYKVLRYPNEVLHSRKEQIIFNDILDRKNSFSLTAPLSAGEGLGVRVLSTKKLQLNQQELLLNAGCSFVEYDAITIEPIPFEFPKNIENIIVTSQNGAKEFLSKYEKLLHAHTEEGLAIKCFCVGQKTAVFLLKKGLEMTEIAQNGEELAYFIAKKHKNDSFYYFCGKQRRDELPIILKEASITFKEIYTYETTPNIKSFNQTFDGVLFYSPSGVEAFAKANTLENTTAFCIGNTTATEAKKHTDHVIVSNATTIESTIAKAIMSLKNNC